MARKTSPSSQEARSDEGTDLALIAAAAGAAVLALIYLVLL
ncbi:hypothetical protein [Bradyrhizobium sp.]|nr:hypothetical protein [Bradyrhizobium sp.]